MEQIITEGMLSSLLNYKMFISTLLFVFGLFLVYFISEKMTPTRSKNYRKLLTDLFVVGKIRKLAKKNDISLSEEETNYKKWLKKGKIENEPLDVVIEEEMKEEISEENLNNLKKTKEVKEKGK